MLGVNMVKYLVWGAQNKDEAVKLEENISNGGSMKCVSPPLATHLQLFSRELVDLLKTASHCQLPFSRFIPAYHHHFGRQCRVADYGYTKLVDLFDALSHIVQVSKTSLTCWSVLCFLIVNLLGINTLRCKKVEVLILGK